MRKKITTDRDMTDHWDQFKFDLGAARAICDAAAVLCALENTAIHKAEGELTTGGGFANGIQLHSDSLSTMLKHACLLMDLAEGEADCMLEVAKAGAQGRIPLNAVK